MSAVVEVKVCDVCRLVDKDETPKPCAYCALCDSWICISDRLRPERRFKAMFLKRQQAKDGV